MRIFRKIEGFWFWNVTLPRQNKRTDATRLLKKMAKVAGYKYEDCRTKTEWLYEKGWTQDQSDKYEKWFKRQVRHLPLPNRQWDIWNLMYGFRIK